MQKYPQTNGFVYLIGAGPGDPGLITVKGRDCIGRADVILYDYLANEHLLAHAAPHAELIYAGKVGGAHNREQWQINELLVEKAIEGKVVARLKGGDPFVFGRGGEEDRPTGLLRVSAINNMASWVLMPIFARFSAKYPEIELHVQVSNKYVSLAERQALLGQGVAPTSVLHAAVREVRRTSPAAGSRGIN